MEAEPTEHGVGGSAVTDIYAQRGKDIVTRDVVSIHEDGDVHEALELMAENRVTVVVDRRNQCVGMLSTSDLIETYSRL